MIDSHCHLDREPIYSSLDKVLQRSKNVGIIKLLTICTSDENFKVVLDLVDKDSMIFGTYGIHPHEADNFKIKKNDIIQKLHAHSKIIGVGETGLDFYYNNSKEDLQIESFENHIKASIETNLPLIVHSRNAENQTFELLNKYKNENLKILMHCFTGSPQFAEKLLVMNSYFSASGIITFKNSNNLQNTFKNIPNDRLLIETDSPFLAPEPHRGKKNEPSFILSTLEKLSKLKNLSTKSLSDITTSNFNRLFGL